ncbi:MAG TPA: hypothetical protein VE287_11335, partial [Actinopolymorphaceae bacterium]|nr:hypothetical protein [Actinopolymorphaceae bacterium]
MISNDWLDTDDRLAPGTEIFRSDRRFVLWAYSVSHGQLLLRSVDQRHETTIDLLFKPIKAVRLRDGYDGLVIRCATAEEAEEAERAGEPAAGRRVFLLETQGRTDHVIGMAVGWHEGVLDRTQHSFFNSADAYEPRWPTQPLDGVGAGFNIASGRDLIAALGADESDRPRRETYRMVYVVMTGRRLGSESGTGVFLSRADAEEACARIAPRVADCWI